MAEDSALLSYQGRRFNTTETDDQTWIRIDELGRALAADPPEQTLLGIHQEHFAQFSERLSILVPVETPEGPRLMRAFNLLGAYVMSTFVPNPQAQQFRRWLLDTLIYFQIDLRREIRKLKENDRRLEAKFEAIIQALIEEIRALREAQAWREDRSWFEGEFHRWHEAQARTAEAVNQLSARIGKAVARRSALSAEEVAVLLRAHLDPLRDGVAGLYERFEALAGAGDRIGAPAALGDGVPVLTLPSQYSLTFHSEAGDRLTVLFWNDAGPWFFVRELADLLAPPEEDLVDLDGFITARVPAAHRGTAKDHDTNEVHLVVSETGLVLLFRFWSEFMPDWDKQRLGRWIADQVIPSALSLRLKETELDPEHRPADFPAAPTEVIADGPGLFKVYAGDLDGRPATLVNARDIYKCLGFRQSYAAWFEDRGRWFGYRNGVHYARVFVKLRQYGHYLTLDAADSLLCQESHPKAIEAREYLREVALERGMVIEGEAVRVDDELELMPVRFQGDTLFITGRDGEPLTPIRPIVEALGLDWRNQSRKFKGGGDIATPFEGDGDIPISPEDGKQPAYRFGIVVVPTRTAGGVQQTLCIPVRKLPGYLYSVSPSKVRVDLREKLVRYQNECDDVLWRHWFAKSQGANQQTPRHAETTFATSADTPPHQPLTIPFKHGNREILVRVAIRRGRPWFLAFDVALIVDEPSDDPRPAFAGVPKAYKELRPTPDGESAALWLDEAGLAYFLGAWPHKPAAERLRDWLLRDARAALRERLGAVPASVAASAAAVPPVAMEDFYTHRDPLFLGCLVLAERRFRGEEPRHRRGGSAVSDNYGRFLAWLLRNAPAEGWLKIESASRFAERTGLPRRSLARAIERAVAWGLVEQRPERPGGWPSEIRLAPGRLESALDAAGMAWRR